MLTIAAALPGKVRLVAHSKGWTEALLSIAALSNKAVYNSPDSRSRIQWRNYDNGGLCSGHKVCNSTRA